MVGGKIVSIQRKSEPDRLRIIVADDRHGRHQSCGVEVAPTNLPLELGDSLWWQGRFCYWTPAGEPSAWDAPIPRFGYSFAVP